MGKVIGFGPAGPSVSDEGADELEAFALAGAGAIRRINRMAEEALRGTGAVPGVTLRMLPESEEAALDDPDDPRGCFEFAGGGDPEYRVVLTLDGSGGAGVLALREYAGGRVETADPETGGWARLADMEESVREVRAGTDAGLLMSALAGAAGLPAYALDPGAAREILRGNGAIASLYGGVRGFADIALLPSGERSSLSGVRLCLVPADGSLAGAAVWEEGGSLAYGLESGGALEELARFGSEDEAREALWNAWNRFPGGGGTVRIPLSRRAYAQSEYPYGEVRAFCASGPEPRLTDGEREALRRAEGAIARLREAAEDAGPE